MLTTPRSEFPRPDFRRDRWMCLNGPWSFAFGDDGADRRKGGPFDREILVPFCYQCAASGIGDPAFHPVVWYQRSIFLTPEDLTPCVLLKFGAVDSLCQLYVNGAFAGSHEGGFTQFAFDIRPFLKAGENRITLRVEDDRSCEKPRGKQYWKDTPDRCWYTETTGIWRSVWLEFVGEAYLTNLRLLPDLDRREIRTECFLNAPFTGTLHIAIDFEGQRRWKGSFSLKNAASFRQAITLDPEDFVDEIHLWSPENPVLYDITLMLETETGICDCVASYFGMREICIRGNQIYLNRRPIYQRLILDQGYWPNTLMTPPSEDSILEDLQKTKAMGFNGVRKHQKAEDPLFYYYADRLGLLVWLEAPSAYAFSPNTMQRSMTQWAEMVQENWNHPSIITYVPLNESWGVRDMAGDKTHRSYAASLYHLTHALDPTRLISTNDGWEFPSETDIYGFHDYFSDSQAFSLRYANWPERFRTGMLNRPLQIGDAPLAEKPLLVTEFGGIAFLRDAQQSGAWGYNQGVESQEDYAVCLQEQVDTVLNIPGCCGYCYTQLTDVMQEVNGLLRPDRTEKLPLEQFCRIFSKVPCQFRR